MAGARRNTWLRRLAVFAGGVSLALATSCAAADVHRPPTVVSDLAGAPCDALAAAGARAAVFLFVDPECPIANVFAPELQRIAREFAGPDFGFRLVYADPAVDPDAVRRHIAEFGYEIPVLLDTQHVLVELTGVTVTPEAAVVSPGGELLYRGRVDDRFADFGKQRAQPSQRDLRDALKAIGGGRRPAPSRTEAIGCFIPDPAGA